ncbi:MAG: dTDP-4-dehydrorhamnose reductase [Rubrivivax sp.]|nr:dTDP-4-dehydrorhamnose reductase [Rubrivivax sp.]
MKVAILGANGQLGSDIAAAYTQAGHEVLPLTHETIEVADLASVRAALEGARPDAVINTSAMHNVEACEADPAKSFAVNGIGARNLAVVTRELGSYLIHFSTDYVVDGLKGEPYVETDLARPLNVYGNTKLAGEHFVLAENPERGAVVRISGVYGMNPCRAKGGMNFIRLMLKLAKERDEIRVVDDEVLTPTFTEDIARQTLELTGVRPAGLFHATSQGACSWHAFASRIFDRVGMGHKLHKARPGEFPAKVKRPSYSVLDNAALRTLGIDVMPSWQDAQDRYLNRLL